MNVLLKRAGLAAVLVIGIFLAGRITIDTFLKGFWPIELVSVEGLLSPGEKQQIEVAVADHIQKGFLFVNLDDVVSSVMALSWPREVKVRRSWPDRLKLDVRKQSLVARWNGSGYLSSSGQIVFDPDLPEQDLPSFFAEHSDGIRAMGIFEGLNGVIQDSGLKMKILQEDSQGNWQVTFENGLKVILGSEDLNTRLGRFVHVYNKPLQYKTDQIASIDARYRNGVAVKWLEQPLVGDSLALAAPKAITSEHR